MAVVTGVRNFVRLLGSTLSLAFNGAIVNNALRGGVRPLGIATEIIEALLQDPTIINQPAFKATLTEAQRMGILNAYLKGFRVVFLLTVSDRYLRAVGTGCSHNSVLRWHGKRRLLSLHSS